MSRASRLDTYLRDHTRTYPHAKTVAYRPQHPRRLRFHLAPQRLQPGRRCAEACGGRAATGRTEHGCTEHPAMPQRPVRGDRPGRQAARAVRQRLRQYRRQRLPGHPDGGARGALEPDPGEGRQGVARRYRRSPVAAHPRPLWLRPRRQVRRGRRPGQGSPGAAFRRHLPQQCQRIHHLRDRWQARHPRCQGQAAHRGALRHHPGQRQRRRTRRLDQRRAWRGEVDHQPRYRRTEGRGLREPGRPPRRRDERQRHRQGLPTGGCQGRRGR